jgi:methionyl-tRNA formyltransferase
MDAKKSIKTVLLTHYNPDSSTLILNLIRNKVHLDEIIFTYTKKRLPWKTRIKNILKSGRFNEPSSILNLYKIPYSFTHSHNCDEVQEKLTHLGVDILLLYGPKIIKKSVLDIPKIGTLNSHSALLPKYRGSKAEFWLLYNNEPEYAGVTIHWVTPGLDEGDIFLQKSLPVAQDETPSSLRAKSVPLSAELFSEALKSIESGVLIRIPQDESKATKFKRPTIEEVNEYKTRYENR